MQLLLSPFKKAVPTAFFISCVFLIGFNVRVLAAPSASTIDGTTSNHSNMIVRVLLQRGGTKSQVKGLIKDLFVKTDNKPGWVKFPNEINLSLQQVKTTSQFLLNATLLNAKNIFVRGGPHQSDKVQYQTDFYRGALKFVQGQKSYDVVNILPLDDYLLGTLGAEMSASWELEALKAQAVASRTYALYMMKHPKHAGFDLDSSTQDQVYGGVDKESARIKQAINETSGLFLAENGEPVKAYYHSRCGGMTETAKAVWNYKSSAFKARVDCPYCRKFPYSWNATIAASELLKTLELPQTFLASLANVKIDKTPSGRISTLKISGNGIEKTITTDELRNLMGYSKLKSARFDWKITGDEVAFDGTGSGHGVGMCQWGARYLAKQGKTFREILAHYYPGIEIRSTN